VPDAVLDGPDYRLKLLELGAAKRILRLAFDANDGPGNLFDVDLEMPMLQVSGVYCHDRSFQSSRHCAITARRAYLPFAVAALRAVRPWRANYRREHNGA